MRTVETRAESRERREEARPGLQEQDSKSKTQEEEPEQGAQWPMLTTAVSRASLAVVTALLSVQLYSCDVQP